MRAALLLSVALLAAPAYAQNNQYQLGDVTADTTVNAGHVRDAGATSVASGNTVTTSNANADASFDSTQHMDGATEANTEASVADADGTANATAAAIGNGQTATTQNGDLALSTLQMTHNDARATVTLNNALSHDAASSASAAGNVVAASADHGDLSAEIWQESTNTVAATATSQHDVVADQAVSGAIASGNNIALSGSTTTVLTYTNQEARGDVAARTDLSANEVTDASANATANANALTIDNEWGYVNTRGRQISSADVSAASTVTLGEDFDGFASAGAYGVGNAVTVSNVGSDTVLDFAQQNSGNVISDAAVDAVGGEMALASSAAYGNSISAGLCNYCDTSGGPGIYANSSQENSGAVHARASATADRTRTVALSATAIGNAATYQTTGPN